MLNHSHWVIFHTTQKRLGSLGKVRNFPFCPKPWAPWRIPDRCFPGYLRKEIRQYFRILFCLKIIGQIIYVGPHEDYKGWKIKSFLAKKFGHSGKILILNNFGHLWKFYAAQSVQAPSKGWKKKIHNAQTVLGTLKNPDAWKVSHWWIFVAARHSGWFSHERESMLARTIVEALLNMRT